MSNPLKDLVAVSRHFGSDKDYTLAGGGNTSYKDDTCIWIKASGASLATITEEGFAQLDRAKVQTVRDKTYSDDEQLRETQVKEDLIAANVYPEKGKRPSVETSFHEIIDYPFVVHMHPTLTNALMCSNEAEKKTRELFGDEVMYIPYAPGYPLFKKVQSGLESYRKTRDHDPEIIFLENHGVFVSAQTTKRIHQLYRHITDTIAGAIGPQEPADPLDVPDDITAFLPALRMMLMENGERGVLSIRHNTLHRHFYPSEETFQKAARPFTPDMIVYCKSAYLYIEETSNPETLIRTFREKLSGFREQYGYSPRIIMLRDYGILAFEENARSAQTALDVYEDLLKVSLYSEAFGGPHFLTDEQIAFVDNWEVENYRRKIARGKQSAGRVDQKIAVVTGAAQGFGEGIALHLAEQGANVVVADLNAEKGRETVRSLSAVCGTNRVVFLQTDVSDPGQVEKLVYHTVREFGGLDLYVSNAGILVAGGLGEMDPEVFGRLTEINYNAWFYGARAASAVMKVQHEINPGYYTDLVQINSKSGLRGSNRNFAYAGAKFGGVGLTQSFALELAPYNIKVNAICPGNFFEGPLWSDPDKGLFVQYLEAGKVPGARTVEDVRRFYEKKVPMGRGCRIEDVMKALYYILDQEYETGQALPVTGGQVMVK